jgi:hypothetical protein
MIIYDTDNQEVIESNKPLRNFMDIRKKN